MWRSPARDRPLSRGVHDPPRAYMPWWSQAGTRRGHHDQRCPMATRRPRAWSTPTKRADGRPHLGVHRGRARNRRLATGTTTAAELATSGTIPRANTTPRSARRGHRRQLRGHTARSGRFTGCLRRGPTPHRQVAHCRNQVKRRRGTRSGSSIARRTLPPTSYTLD